MRGVCHRVTTVEALLRDRSVLYVTGKGGVGKTTVAAALGLAAARTGRRTIVCEVAEQDRMSRAFARHGVRPEQEVELAEDLWAITIDPTQALLEWLGKQAGGAAGRILGHSHTFQYFVAAAPGAKELITIAKVWELAQKQRWDKHNRRYDLVVVDAPASGHGIGMLTTPRTFGEIARVGPIRRQATKVSEMLADPKRTGYVAVALPEEMPVNETIELERRLRDAIGLGLDALVMNAMWPERFSSSDVTKLRAADPRRPRRVRARRRARGARRARARQGPARAPAPAGRGDRRADHDAPVRLRVRAGPGRLRAAGGRVRDVISDPARRLSPLARWVWALQQLDVLGRRDRGRHGRGCERRRSAAHGCGRCRSWCWWLAVTAVPALRWRRWRWDIRDEGIDIQHGTLAVSRTLVPWVRVQHVDTRRGVFEQMFGLSTVVVHTAAGGHTIPLLPAGDAEQLRERIAGLARTDDD